MSKDFIEFDEGQPAPEAEPKPEAEKEGEKADEVEARLARIEKALMGVVKVIKKLQEDAEVKPEAEPEKEGEVEPEAKPADEEEVKEALKEMKTEYAKLAKDFQELKSAPARVTLDTAGQDGTEKRVEKFLSNVTGAEMLVWAEKRGVKWGQKKLGD